MRKSLVVVVHCPFQRSPATPPFYGVLWASANLKSALPCRRPLLWPICHYEESQRFWSFIFIKFYFGFLLTQTFTHDFSKRLINEAHCFLRTVYSEASLRYKYKKVQTKPRQRIYLPWVGVGSSSFVNSATYSLLNTVNVGWDFSLWDANRTEARHTASSVKL